MTNNNNSAVPVTLEQKDLDILHQQNHDLKNHLMSIRGYLHILGKRVKDDESLLNFVKIIDEKIEKIADISNAMVNDVENKKTLS